MCVYSLWQLPDVQTAWEFRKEMYDYMGVPMPTKPSNKVLFWFRTPPLGRSVLNTPEVLALADSYNLSYT